MCIHNYVACIAHIYHVYIYVRAWDFPTKVSLKGNHAGEKFTSEGELADELSAGDSPD